MTENSKEEKTLSFKEQILRDLEHAREMAHPMEKESSRSEAYVSEQEQVPVDIKQEDPVKEETIAEPELEETKELPKVPIMDVPTSEETKVISPILEQVVSESSLKDTSVESLEEIQEESEDFSRLSRSVQSSKKNRQNRVAGRIVGTVIALIVVAVLAMGFFGYSYYNSSLQPVDKESTEFVTVEIPAGSGTKAIGKVLEEAGLIKNATIFNYYTKFKNYGNFQSGYYNLQKSMDLDTISKKLQEGGTETPQEPVLVKVVIPEGYTLTQIAATVEESTKKLGKKAITAEAFLKRVQEDSFIEQASAKYSSLLATLPTKESGVKYRLEGYLFPATYQVTESTTLDSLLDDMLAATHTALSPYYNQLAGKGLNVNDVLTLASLVEKEGATDEDRKNIASVFYNRLNQGMALQSNIAILYAQDKLGQKTSLAEDASIDTNIDSPYNIYKNTGLMPGPVDSPGASAIEATVNPNKTTYLYFVANVETGAVYFANTYEEHSKNVEDHVNSKLAQ